MADFKYLVDRFQQGWNMVNEPLNNTLDRKSYKAEGTGIVRNPRRESRPLSEEDIDGFIEAAEMREEPLWEDIEKYLTGPLLRHSPTRAKMLRREIRWMRRMAAKDGLDWGSRD